MVRERGIRGLHLGITVCVLLQLLVEQFIGLPENPTRHRFGAWLVALHELVGMLALILAGTYLAIRLDNLNHRKRLYPWLFADARAQLWRELRHDVPAWIRGTKPWPASGGLLAGMVHGAGAALVLLLGLTGSLLFISAGIASPIPPEMRGVLALHGLLADAMWVFLLGHVGMALVHEVKGHKIVRAVFHLGRAPEQRSHRDS